MNPRQPSMNYDATASAHANGYELEVLADLASHQFDDLDSSHASSSWRQPSTHSSASAATTPSTPFVPSNSYWTPVHTVQPAMTSHSHHHSHHTTHHHGSPSQPSFSSYDQPGAPPPTPIDSGSASRYAASIASSGGDERFTADEAELRRQRNTAASARFRAKKKRREQSLERGAREKRERLAELEGRIRELEVENGWLRDLIMETTGAKGRKDKEKEKGREGEKDGEPSGGIVVQEPERRGRERKDGVGTGR